jgi:hypothetical protein
VLQGVLGDLGTPGKRVQSEIENPGIGLARRAAGVHGQAAIIHDADRRNLVSGSHLRRDRSGIRRAGDRDRTIADQFLEELARNGRRRVIIIPVQFERAAEYASFGIDLFDRQLSAPDGG